MSRQSVAKAHQKIQELAWEPQYHEPLSQYGTDGRSGLTHRMRILAS